MAVREIVVIRGECCLKRDVGTLSPTTVATLVSPL